MTLGRFEFLVACALWLAACSVAPTQETPAAAALPPPLELVASPPEWRPGDRWVYVWTSGAETGSRTLEVLEIKEVNRVRYYIVRLGDVEHYYTPELHWAGAIKESIVQARMVPPQSLFTWPLEVGRRWTHSGVYKDGGGERRHNDTFAVVGPETLTVPAGRFETLKIVRETGTRDSDEYWYAPEVRWYARWRGRRGDVEFDEQLREYQPAPRLIPESAPPPATR